MSKIALSGPASGTATYTISAPTGATDRTITLPDQTGTLLTGSGAIGVNSSAATNSLVIDASGNVGIGTSSPGRPLHVASSSTSYLARFQNSGSALALINFKDNTTSDFNVGVGANGENFVAYTSNTERARIDSSGRLLVGTTSGIANGTFCVKSNYAGAEACSFQGGSNNFIVTFHNTSGTLIGSITGSNGSTTSYNTSSDYRLKEDIQPMTGALTKVAALKPVTYKWKADGSDGQGFIAHELAEVCPDAVSGEKDEVNEDGSIKPQGIDTSFLVATLTAALQELKAINDAQAQTITALTARVTALEGTQP